MRTLKYIALFVPVLLIQAACTTGFEDYNKNPNVPEYWAALPISLLEETIFSGADGMLYRTYLLNGELVQYTVSGTSNNAYHRYVIGNAVMAGVWNSLYTWAANAEHVRQLSRMEERKDVNCEAMAMTMKAFYLSNATDIFGDIPCSEAFRSRPYYDDDNNLVEQTNLKPVFDTQKDVYRQLFATLEKANSLYNASSSLKTPSKDLVYGGDVSKWKKFNNSLYLRLLMRLSNRYTESMTMSRDGQSVMGVLEKINEIIDKPEYYPVFESNEDNATLFYSGETPYQNRFGNENVAGFGGRKAAKTLIDMMAELQDPRLSSYFVQRGGEWNGLPSGAGAQETTSDNVAILNKDVLGLFDSPYSLMKYDEVLFILSEAVKIGALPGGDSKAKEYYEAAITASIRYWVGIDPKRGEIADATIANFINNFVPYDYTLENILNQKYIAQFWNGYEAWHDYRRTGYPRLKIGNGTFNDHVLPTRFAYPIRTATTNPDNYATAVERLRADYKGNDDMKAPVWWSKQAAAIK